MNEPTQRVRVLVVDDETFVSVVFRRTLARDYEVVTAASAEEALALLESGQRFDVVVSDTNLGAGMWGPEFLGVVRERWSTIACVIMSGDDQGAAKMAMEDGRAQAFMAKPWESGEPEACIAAAIAKVQGRSA